MDEQSPFHRGSRFQIISIFLQNILELNKVRTNLFLELHKMKHPRQVDFRLACSSLS